MRITVNPEQLRQMAQVFRQAQHNWEELGRRLQAQQMALNWEVHQQQVIEEQIGQAVRLAQALAEGAAQRAARLEEVAARFEAADREGYSSLSIPFPRLPVPPIPPESGGWIDWSSVRTTLPITRLIPGIVPALGGLGVFVLSGTLLQNLGDLLERLRNWIRSYGRLTDKLRTSSPPQAPPSKSQKEGTTAESRPPSQPPQSPPSSPSDSSIDLKDVKPNPDESCTVYAQKRRPDLGVAEKVGAFSYIEQYGHKRIHIEKDDVLREKIKKGYAIVWERGQHRWANKDYGHVAIVEDVIVKDGKEYVLVSQAGVGTETKVTTYPEPSMWMLIPKEKLLDLFIIGP